MRAFLHAPTARAARFTPSVGRAGRRARPLARRGGSRFPRRFPRRNRHQAGRAYDRLTHVLKIAGKRQAPAQSAVPERGAVSLEEIDLIDGRNFVAGVPHEWFAELRREAPVYWHPEEVAPRGGFWAVTRYDDCVHVNRDWEHFSSARRGLALCRRGRRPAGPAAADDAQHGPDHARATDDWSTRASRQRWCATWSSRSSGTPTASSTRCASAAPPTSSRRSPPSSRSSSSPSCSAYPRRTAAWSSTGRTG